MMQLNLPELLCLFTYTVKFIFIEPKKRKLVLLPGIPICVILGKMEVLSFQIF